MRRSSLFSRRQRHYISLIIALVTLVIYLGQQHGWFGGAVKVAESNQPGLYTIDHYIDGDTIAVNMNGQVEEIRFIGADTPETHKPNTPVQCYGPEDGLVMSRGIPSFSNGSTCWGKSAKILIDRSV